MQTQGSYDLDRYLAKTYIPITNFPAQRTVAATRQRDKFLGVINNLLVRQTGLEGGMHTGIMYLIDEAVNNIVDHADTERGYIFAQYFPSTGFFDICIADGGQGLLQRYRSTGNMAFKTDVEAIAAAADGVSTKNAPGAEGRGFGIRTSKSMLVDGIGGSYFLQSGAAFLVKTPDFEELRSLPEVLSHTGSLVAIRILNIKNTAFNATPYYS